MTKVIINIKFFSAVFLISLWLTDCSPFENGIPKDVGNWRVEVGPEGNEFYEPSLLDPQPPSKKLLHLVKDIAPLYTEITEWKKKRTDQYFIRAKGGPEVYDFIISPDAKLIEIQYENESNNVKEEPDKLVLKGGKKRVELSEVPQNTLQTISKAIPGSYPNQVWIASTIAGKRYVIAVGETIFYARLDGQIQAVGLIGRGALDEINPPVEKKSQEEIIVEVKEKLRPYRKRFNIDNQIEKLGNMVPDDDGNYRFVVIGDSRSNPELWFSIVKHVDQLNPKPAFVISTGDIVRTGFTEEYIDYFIPPLLETNLNYFVSIGNHDDGADGKAIEYQYLFGENSLNYFFDYCKTRYVFFDNVTKVNPYEESLEWLNTVLANTPKGFNIVVVAHKPIATIEKWAYHSWNRKNSDTFAELMSKYSVDHVFFGHIHAYSTATFNGVSYTITGGGGAGLHDRYGPLGNIHHYIICDVMNDGSINQNVVRFYKKDD